MSASTLTLSSRATRFTEDSTSIASPGLEGRLLKSGIHLSPVGKSLATTAIGDDNTMQHEFTLRSQPNFAFEVSALALWTVAFCFDEWFKWAKDATTFTFDFWAKYDVRDLRIELATFASRCLCSLLWHHATSANFPCSISGGRST